MLTLLPPNASQPPENNIVFLRYAIQFANRRRVIPRPGDSPLQPKKSAVIPFGADGCVPNPGSGEKAGKPEKVPNSRIPNGRLKIESRIEISKVKPKSRKLKIKAVKSVERKKNYRR